MCEQSCVWIASLQVGGGASRRIRLVYCSVLSVTVLRAPGNPRLVPLRLFAMVLHSYVMNGEHAREVMLILTRPTRRTQVVSQVADTPCPPQRKESY